MAAFRGVVHGSRQSASRLGTVHSGVLVQANSWRSKVKVKYWTHPNKETWVLVCAEPFDGGRALDLFSGPEEELLHRLQGSSP